MQPDDEFILNYETFLSSSSSCDHQAHPIPTNPTDNSLETRTTTPNMQTFMCSPSSKSTDSREQQNSKCNLKNLIVVVSFMVPSTQICFHLLACETKIKGTCRARSFPVCMFVCVRTCDKVHVFHIFHAITDGSHRPTSFLLERTRSRISSSVFAALEQTCKLPVRSLEANESPQSSAGLQVQN